MAGDYLYCYLGKTIDQALIDAVLDKRPEKFICLDAAFHNNDQLKANAVKPLPPLIRVNRAWTALNLVRCRGGMHSEVTVSQIEFYPSGDDSGQIEVRLSQDTVWLNRQQLAHLFGRDVKTIGKHLNNVFSEGELSKAATVAFLRQFKPKAGGR